jgi:hypothetical protein
VLSQLQPKASRQRLGPKAKMTRPAQLAVWREWWRRQPAGEEAHKRWLRHWGASRSLSGKEKRTMGSPSSVSMARWLGWRCTMAVVASGEPWWLATTLAVLCSSRWMGGHLGAGQFGGKAVRGWSSTARGKMVVKLRPIPVMTAMLRRP